MSIEDVIKVAVQEVYSVEQISGGVRVSTHCMYPSNGLVQVSIRGHGDTYFVSDDGGALSELTATGVSVSHSDKALAPLARKMGVDYREGILTVPPCDVRTLPLAILVVANASKELAMHLYAHTKIERKRDFKAMVRQYLAHKFVNAVPNQEVEIIGKTHKVYKFANVVQLDEKRRLVVDPIVHDHSAISARVLANLDVRNANHDGLEQRIVYDDEQDWSNEDLSILTMGAQAIGFSRADEAFRKFANPQGNML